MLTVTSVTCIQLDPYAYMASPKAKEKRLSCSVNQFNAFCRMSECLSPVQFNLTTVSVLKEIICHLVWDPRKAGTISRSGGEFSQNHIKSRLFNYITLNSKQLQNAITY